jgi:hypothetical protein
MSSYLLERSKTNSRHPQLPEWTKSWLTLCPVHHSGTWVNIVVHTKKGLAILDGELGEHRACAEATAMKGNVKSEFCRNTSKLFDSLVGCLMMTANMSADY